MATKVSKDEKFENQDFDLFKALEALDKKDYAFFERLTEEQQKKFVPYMMTHWMSQVKDKGGVQGYYVMSVNYHANQHLFNENVMKHPKLQWLMLCASSPDLGKKFHQWVPHLSSKITSLKDTPKVSEVKDYFSKIYTGASQSDLNAISEAFVDEYKKKVYLAEKFPNLKHEDIEILSNLITEDDILQYEKDSGN